MKKEEAINCLKKMEDTLNPFHPTNNPEVSVWAYWVREPMNVKECDGDGKKLFYFEIFTEEQIEYLLSDSKDKLPFLYSFTATDQSANYEYIYELQSALEENEFLHLTLKSPKVLSNINEHHIDGILHTALPIPAKYRNQDNIPLFSDAALCWEKNSLHTNANDKTPPRLADIITKTENSINHTTDDSIPDSKNSNDQSAAECKITVQIFKVGSANSIYIKYSNGKSILLDCGVDLHNKTSYIKSTNHLTSDKIQPTTIIITHWHADHYELLADIDCSRLENIIAPSKNNMSHNQKIYLSTIKKSKQKLSIYYLSEMIQQNPIKDLLLKLGYPKTTIFLGTGSEPNDSKLGKIQYSNKINDTAIILSIGSDDNRMILPSDVSYYSWPLNEPELNINKIHKLLLPHHGGNVYTKNNTSCNTNTDVEIYISSRYKQFTDIDSTYHKTYITSVFPQCTSYKFTEDDIKILYEKTNTYFDGCYYQIIL